MNAERLLPRYTVNDYQLWNGDWELWDGFAIAMSPSPFGRHQVVAGALHLGIGNAIENQSCDARAISELDWVVNESTVVRPDLIVVCGDVPERHLETPPGLVAEVLSPSTRENDLNFKLDLYQSQRVPTYLILDPESKQLTCHRLGGDRYESTTHQDQVEVTICNDCQIKIDVAKLFR